MENRDSTTSCTTDLLRDAQMKFVCVYVRESED